MSQDEISKENLQKGKQIVVLVLSLLYTAMNQLFAGLNLFPELTTDDLNVGLFVTATGAIIFGRGSAGAAAGLGQILEEVQKMLAGEGSLLHLGTVVSAASFGIGTWLTGFLGRKENKLPLDFSDVLFTKTQVKKLGMDTIAALIGTALVSNFLYIFGSQLQEGASLTGGVPIFVSQFLEDSLVLIIFVPITLIMFDFMQVFNKKRDAIMEALLRKIETRIEVNDCTIEEIDVSLPQRSLTVGLWSPIVLKFTHVGEKETVYSMEAVSTSKLYPHKDRTIKMKKGDRWTQTFFALPSKQESVNVRMRIIPIVERSFKQAIKEETIIEFEVQTRSQTSMINTLIGFSGINGALLGGAVIWDQILQLVADYQKFVDQIKNSSTLIIYTALAEVGIFVPVLGTMYVRQKRKLDDGPLKLSFSDDIEDQTYEEIIQKKLTMYIERYKTKLQPLSRFSVYIAAIGTIIVLGREGWFYLSNPEYSTADPEAILLSVVILLGTWIFGLRGTELLHELGILKESPFEFKKGSVITKFQPMGQFQEGKPTEVLVVAKNPSTNNGIRIKFECFDTLSPNMVELHIAPKETAQFKIAVTPLKKEKQDVLALVYPLFDENNKYIDFNEAEPINKQEISYEVVGQTALGVTQKQADMLKKVGGLGGVLTGALYAVNEYIGIPNFETVVRDTAPYLAAMQAPFIYAYFNISNRLQQMSK
ncbi:MAG: hypothetical protein INQ03_14800 [Candidatus Heimdallarchaeota archaeon]|nr:hypothetical protein [Candidatus Heimdallarchaeota archaeon]